MNKFMGALLVLVGLGVVGCAPAVSNRAVAARYVAANQVWAVTMGIDNSTVGLRYTLGAIDKDGDYPASIDIQGGGSVDGYVALEDDILIFVAPAKDGGDYACGVVASEASTLKGTTYYVPKSGKASEVGKCTASRVR